MSAVIISCVYYNYQKNNKTGKMYAYSSVYYKDPETGKLKTRRTYLGRVDPETKAILPKATGGRRNRSMSPATMERLPEEFVQEVEELKKQISDLQAEVSRLTREKQKGEQLVRQFALLLENYNTESEPGHGEGVDG